MELAEEQIRELIEQLQDHHYRARFIALGKLIEAGTVAVPALTEALYHPDKPLRVRAACALAGIGATDASVVMPIIDLWEEGNNAYVFEALEVLARKIAATVRTEHIRVLLRLLVCYKTVYSNGRDLSLIAAGALETLAKRAPSPHLQDALPLLPHANFFNSNPPEFNRVAKAIQDALKPDGLKSTVSQDLPVPADSPGTSGEQ